MSSIDIVSSSLDCDIGEQLHVFNTGFTVQKTGVLSSKIFKTRKHTKIMASTFILFPAQWGVPALAGDAANNLFQNPLVT